MAVASLIFSLSWNLRAPMVSIRNEFAFENWKSLEV